MNKRTFISIVLIILSSSFAWPQRRLVKVYEASMRGYEWQIFYFYDDFTYEFSAWSHIYGNYLFDKGTYIQKDSILTLNSSAVIQSTINEKEYGGRHFHLCKNFKLVSKESYLLVLNENPRIHFKKYFRWNEEELFKLNKISRD